MIRILCPFFLILLSLNLHAGSLIFVRGDVLLNGQTAQKLAMIKEGDLLQTGEKSLVLVELGASKFKLDQNSQLKIQMDKKRNQELQLDYGQTVFSLVRDKIVGEGVPLKVKSKSVAMGVRGTKFFVSQKKDTDDLFMCVEEGQVEIKNEAEKSGQKVNPGEGVRSKSGSTSDPQPLPWTKNLNWNLDPEEENLEQNFEVGRAYLDLLNLDYD